jgi:glutaredoxin-related protein
MKKILFTLVFIFSLIFSYGQTNEEIAGVYIRKAEKNYSNIEIDEAAKNFSKAIKLLDTVNKASIARLGTLIQFELREYDEAKKYARFYFKLVKSKKSEDYTQLLDLYVTIEEELEKIELEKLKQEKARLAREKETRRIDSLKTVWQNKADALTLKITSIDAFNKNNISVFKNGEFIGIVDHLGNSIVKADTYKAVKNYDGFILLLDKEKEPTKIYSYNTHTKSGVLLPSVSEFNTLSTHFGNVMMPRGNGTIVTYPNNSFKAYIYNVNTKQFAKIADEKALFKELRKTDKIDKYNKEGQVKLGKEWYNFGGHIGGGVYVLYKPDYKLHGFLCSLDGTVLKTNNYQGIGAFHNGKYHVINDGESYWVNQNGTKVSDPTNETGKYTGNSKIVSLQKGGFQIHQKIDGYNYIVLGDEKLEFLEDFLRKHP